MMQRRQCLIGLGALALSLSPVAAFASAANTGDPYEWVVDLSNRVLDKIKGDAALRDGNVARIQELVDGTIKPNVDFRMVTRMTIGPRWRQATPEQREELQKLFEQLLIRVYSGGLKQITDNVCELRPSRNRLVSDDMVVRTLLKSPSEPKPIAMDYRIYKNKEGQWKIIDMNVEGIWMVENYHAQFASVLNEGGVEGLIKELRSKVEAQDAPEGAAK